MGHDRRIYARSSRLFLGNPQDTNPDYTLIDLIYPQLDFNPLSRNVVLLKRWLVNYCNNCIGDANSSCQHDLESVHKNYTTIPGC